MTMRRSFSEVLDECIERVRARSETIDACVADYPEYAVELRDALSAAAVVDRAFAFQPDASRKRAARLRFHDAIDRRRRRRNWWRLPIGGLVSTGPRIAATALVVVLALAGSGTGTVLAAEGSGPGEILYPVKRATERIQLAFAVTEERESRLRAKLMERRMKELAVVTDHGRERFVAELVTQIERHSARAHALAAAPVRRVVDELPALGDSAPAAPVRPAMTPGSPSRRAVSVRRVVLLNDQLVGARQRIASFEKRVSEGSSKRDLKRLRAAIERTHQGLEDLLDKADSAHRVRGADTGPGPSASNAPTDVRTIRVQARIKGVELVHDGKNLLGVDVRVVADEDGRTHVAHLTRRGTKLTAAGRPGRIKQLTLDQRVVLIVDGATGEILELRIDRARRDAEREGEQPDLSGSGSGRR